MECGYSANSGATMSAPTLYKCATTYYDVENMGRDSPGVPLLDMLAEVASQTLHSEKSQTENTPKKENKKWESCEKKNQECSYNLEQLLTMPATQLLKQFTIFQSDELKRQYSYTCSLIPDCCQKYTSFASEIRARMSIKSHIIEHLEFFKSNSHLNTTFIPLSSKHRKPKILPSIRKTKKELQVKKPQELLNKENKDVPDGTGSYLRKILSNEVNSTESEKQYVQETIARVPETSNVKREPQKQDTKFLRDHSYFEQMKVDNEEKDEIVDETHNTIVDGIVEENIMLMVVESDGVHVKELPYIVQKVAREAQEDKINHNANQVNLSKSMDKIGMESALPTKPKGKAKFIGTSKEEREMALALIERIKKKGNPSGSNLQCRICDPPRSFTAPTTLVSHYRSHAGIKPYECRICRAVFTRRHSLKYHMLIHQNQTRFTCADCEKKFRHPSHFREHRRRHTGEAPFGCDDCGQRFKTRNTYKRHLKTRHGKVLTTSGELLCLSEEDFQKVKTNRRKKSEVTTEPTREVSIATNAIIQYQKCDVDQQSESNDMFKDVTCDAESMNENANNVWNYCGYESAGEFHINKTEFLKTEMSEEMDTNVVKQAFDFNEEGNLQIMHSDILYNDDPLYNVDSINEYMDVNYEDFVVKKNDVEEDKDQEESEEKEERVQHLNVEGVEEIQEENCIREFEDGYSECIKHLEAQNENISYANENIEFKQTEEHQLQRETQEYIIPKKEEAVQVMNTEPTETLLKEENTITLSSEEKTVKLAAPQIKIFNQQTTPTIQMLKKGKVTILGKAGQILNLSQNGKQSAILLLSTADPKVMKFLKINTNGEALKTVAVADK